MDETCGVPVLEVHYLVTNMIHLFAVWNHGCHNRSLSVLYAILLCCVYVSRMCGLSYWQYFCLNEGTCLKQESWKQQKFTLFRRKRSLNSAVSSSVKLHQHVGSWVSMCGVATRKPQREVKKRLTQRRIWVSRRLLLLTTWQHLKMERSSILHLTDSCCR